MQCRKLKDSRYDAAVLDCPPMPLARYDSGKAHPRGVTLVEYLKARATALEAYSSTFNKNEVSEKRLLNAVLVA